MLTCMAAAFIDPRDETPALWRAAILLRRVSEDAGGADPELQALEAGVGAMRRAAAAGRLIHHSAIERLEAVLGRVNPPAAPPIHATLCELLRWNALAEMRELLRRLGRARPAAARTSERTGDLSHAAS